MRPLCLVELKGAGDAFEHVFRDAAGVAALEPRVVLDADPGEHGGFFAAQALHASPAAEGGEPGLLGGDLGSPRGQELPDVAPAVHGGNGTSDSTGQGVPADTPLDRDSLRSATSG